MPGSTSVTASTARPPASTTRSPTSFACSTMPPATRFTRASGDCDRRLPPERDDPDRLAVDFLCADEVLLRADVLLRAEVLLRADPRFDADPRLAVELRRAALPDDVFLRADVLLRAAPPFRADDLRALAPDRLPLFAELRLDPLRLLALFAELRPPLLRADPERLLEPPRLRADPPDRAPPPLLPARPLFRAVLRLRADFDAVAMCVLPVGGVCIVVQDSRTLVFAQ